MRGMLFLSKALFLLVICFVRENQSFTCCKLYHDGKYLSINSHSKMSSISKGGNNIHEEKRTQYSINKIKYLQQLKSVVINGRPGRVISFIASMLLGYFFSISNVFAANMPGIKGWDLYGRVPYDDWLFSTWSLTSKHLLKQSLTEIVMSTYYINFHSFTFL